MEVSNDGGRSYIVPAKTFSGNIGQGVSPGSGRAVVWNAEADFDGMLAEQMQVRVSARAGTVPVPPPNMVFIPGGHFYMGEWEGDAGAGAARSVYISPMFMDRYEVWVSLYAEVREWGLLNGYSMNAGSVRAGDHPRQNISWYDAVKWCNARSEREGLTPVYYTGTIHNTVYRSGTSDLTNAMVKWDANGYRLPTEAEWEKASRGGLSGKRYPWGDTVNGTMANYSGVTHPWSGTSPRTTPVGYYNGAQQGGGSDMANGFGLYDMAGNVWERCWDRYSSNAMGESNPRGPDSGSLRVLRGGSWDGATSSLRCSFRDSHSPSEALNFSGGFRCVKGL
jgi:formylglycine-generating enzyme required for sulfatase activity